MSVLYVGMGRGYACGKGKKTRLDIFQSTKKRQEKLQRHTTEDPRLAKTKKKERKKKRKQERATIVTCVVTNLRMKERAFLQGVGRLAIMWRVVLPPVIAPLSACLFVLC